MDSQKVDMFLMTYGKYFHSHHLQIVRDQLLKLDDNQWSMMQLQQYKDPTTSLIISILAGSLGIDRFMIGDTGMGVGKLLTCGGFGVWTIIDWFLIMDATREKNIEKFNQVVNGGGFITQ